MMNAEQTLNEAIGNFRREGTPYAKRQAAELAALCDALPGLIADAEAYRKMKEALEKIADLQGSYGPFPEANSPEWRAMAIVTAREALYALPDEVTK